MKTLTIKQDIIDSLDSDKKKLEFANSIIDLLSDSEKTTGSKHDEILLNGLNAEIPIPMDGAPDFDSDNMSAPEFRRYSLLRAGYVPAGIRGLDCSYSDYEYKHLSTFSKFEIDSLWELTISKLQQNWKKRDYSKFLRYLCDIYGWFYYTILLPSGKREDIDA